MQGREQVFFWKNQKKHLGINRPTYHQLITFAL